MENGPKQSMLQKMAPADIQCLQLNIIQTSVLTRNASVKPFPYLVF